MSQYTTEQSTRMDMRVPQPVRDIIDRAAAMQGRTRTDFVLEAALEKAEQIIERQTIIRLALQDQELLVKALTRDRVEDTPQYVKDIAQEYTARVISE
ncbi:MAG: DUF1778 domain-containing protein [Deltaproteobacteria bacterium]|jgi:uncharacterized protein (DUF1778 family)|nr:DUF1778 domain-containing protein [Deltaproteobacteria bacterium]